MLAVRAFYFLAYLFPGANAFLTREGKKGPCPTGSRGDVAARTGSIDAGLLQHLEWLAEEAKAEQRAADTVYRHENDQARRELRE